MSGEDLYEVNYRISYENFGPFKGRTWAPGSDRAQAIQNACKQIKEEKERMGERAAYNLEIADVVKVEINGWKITLEKLAEAASQKT